MLPHKRVLALLIASPLRTVNMCLLSSLARELTRSLTTLSARHTLMIHDKTFVREKKKFSSNISLFFSDNFFSSFAIVSRVTSSALSHETFRNFGNSHIRVSKF